MHLIRRSVFRATRASSFVSQPRTISTSSPFLLRSRKQAAVSHIFKRFASDDVAAENEKGATPESSDGHSPVSSTVASTVASTAEKVSSYASDAAGSVTEVAHKAKQSVVDALEEGAAAARFGGRGFQQRGRDQGYSNDQSRGFDRARDSGSNSRDARPPLNLSPSPGIYIGNLRFEVTEGEIEQAFAEFGNIKSVRLAVDSRGLSKGFAYVEFENVEQANAAIRARNQTIFEGRRLVVNYQTTYQTRARPLGPPSKTLFIGNLAYEMTDADLNKLFRDIKNVIDVRVAIDRRTGQPRGFAHADFVDVDSATHGREMLAGKEVYGRKLRVDFSATPSTKWRESNEGASDS